MQITSIRTTTAGVEAHWKLRGTREAESLKNVNSLKNVKNKKNIFKKI